MRDSCPVVWAVNGLTSSLSECEAKLAALPLAEGETGYIDSNTCAHSSHNTNSRTTPPLSAR